MKVFGFSCITLLLVIFLTGCGGNPQAGLRVLRRPKDNETSSNANSNNKKKNDKKSKDDQSKSETNPTLRKPGGSKAQKTDPKVGVESKGHAYASANAVKPEKTRKKPEQPLTLEKRIEMTEKNLRTLASALKAYVGKHDRFPSPTIRISQFNTRSRQLLSWRVYLLPTLGHSELYEKFRLDEPWNSEHNLKLLDEIPAVYQSPERFDNKTNYLGVLGRGYVFDPSFRDGLARRRVIDGLRKSIAIVEVDEYAAVPWTKPVDFQWKVDLDGLGKLRGERFFAVWGDFSISQVNLGNFKGDVRLASFKVDANKAFVKSDFSSRIATKLESPKVEVAGASGSNSGSNQDAKQGGVKVGDIRFDPKTGKSTFATADTKRHKIPAEDDVEKVTEELRELYEAEWKDADSDQKKAAIAKSLLKRSEEVEDPTTLYTVLKICRTIATQNEDLPTALSACERLARNFQLDIYEIKVETVKDYIGRLEPQEEAKVDKHIEPLIDELFVRERYPEALEICQILLGQLKKKEARKNRGSSNSRTRTQKKRRAKVIETSKMAKLTKKVKKLKAFDRAHRRAMAALEKEDVEGATDKNLAVGMYLSFYRLDWANGLAVLSKAGTSRVARIAGFDRQNPTKPMEKYELAESWWDYGDTSVDDTIKHSAHERAGFWYAQVESSLPAGLERLKTRERLDQVAEARKKKEKEGEL